MSRDLWKNRPASKFEACAVSDYGSWKRDALLFDKIYVSKYTSDEIRPPSELTFNIENYDDGLQVTRDAISGSAAGYVDPSVLLEAAYGSSDHKTIKQIEKRGTADQCAKSGIDVTPVYETNTLFYDDFPEGMKITYDAAINNLPVLNDFRTSWEQIVAFREDKESVRKYRSLRRFLHHTLKSDSVQEATDTIEKMIEDYAWTIKKHGMETNLGAFSQIFDWKQTSIMAGSAAALTAAGSPILAALSTGILTGASAVIYLKQRSIDLEDITRGPNSEIAILYDAQQEFGA